MRKEGIFFFYFAVDLIFSIERVVIITKPANLIAVPKSVFKKQKIAIGTLSLEKMNFVFVQVFHVNFIFILCCIPVGRILALHAD